MRDRQDSIRPPLVVVSNRGPVEHHIGTDNQVEVRRASGGLATALSAFRRHHDFSWIASAITPGDHYVGNGAKHSFDATAPSRKDDLRTGSNGAEGRASAVDLVAVSKDVFHNHYDVFGNRILWFLQHSMWDLLQAPKDNDTICGAWWNGYVPTNAAFARAVVAKVKRQKMPVIMLHDYHLYMAPGLIRQRHPEAVLQHFVHIPWPAPESWQHLPRQLRREIYRNFLANDIVGFQTSTSAHNFLRCCEQFLEEAEVDYAGKTVSFRKRMVRVRVYPISVDVGELREAMRSPVMRQHRERLLRHRGEQTVVRVDRLDPSKNILRGFGAFERLLDAHQELRGRVKFLAFLVPSRTQIKEYARYRDEVMRLAKAINTKFGGDGFRPIEILYENNYYQALAGMSLCDVLLVNPLADGMNLVAKEGPIVNTRDGVLVLSRMAGAFAQLQDAVLHVEPTDVDGTARALADALAMPKIERHERLLSLRAKIEKEDITSWIASQMNDISKVLAERRAGNGNEQQVDFGADVVRLPMKKRSIACRVPVNKR
ncbi:MAG: trehalose-6-phosphate synthase [Chloroflexi bacterium]|nr:trehalose-6-phosphate synthase [Chloroflexota bacterium]